MKAIKSSNAVKTDYDAAFDARYTYEYAMAYYLRHKKGFFHVVSNILEQRMARKALKMANFPSTIVDLPCGAGRFWNTLIQSGALSISGIDRSAGMLQVCKEMTDPKILQYVNLQEGDAANIPLKNKAVEALICMRLLHHINDRTVREQMYKEFQRVAKKYVLISFWVDGNLKSFRNQGRPGKNRYMPVQELEAELKESGFKIVGKVDMLPGYLPWRLYVLSV